MTFLPAAHMERMRMIKEDAERDALTLDGQPFTGATVAPLFGILFAQVKGIADTVEGLIRHQLRDADVPLEEAREALRFYADPDNWAPHPRRVRPVMEDLGARAREALGIPEPDGF